MDSIVETAGKIRDSVLEFWTKLLLLTDSFAMCDRLIASLIGDCFIGLATAFGIKSMK